MINLNIVKKEKLQLNFLCKARPHRIPNNRQTLPHITFSFPVTMARLKYSLFSGKMVYALKDLGALNFVRDKFAHAVDVHLRGGACSQTTMPKFGRRSVHRNCNKILQINNEMPSLKVKNCRLYIWDMTLRKRQIFKRRRYRPNVSCGRTVSFGWCDVR